MAQGGVETSVRIARENWRGTLVACGAAAVGALIWAHAVGAGAGAGSDFTSYLNAAHDAARGLNPYRTLVTQVQNAQPGDVGIHPHGYVYPPLLCVLLSLPVRLHLNALAMWWIWQGITMAGMLWMGFELNVTLRGRRDVGGTLAFACACLLPAVATYDLWLGQTDLLMAALGVGACGLWLRGNRWAPLPLAVAIAVKPTMALLLAVWLWNGDWRAALRGAIVAGVLLVAPFAMAGGAQALRDYVTFYAHWSAFNADAEFINQAPVGLLLRLFSVNPYTHPLVDAPWLVGPLKWLVMAAAVGCWVWAAPAAWRLESRPKRLGGYRLAGGWPRKTKAATAARKDEAGEQTPPTGLALDIPAGAVGTTTARSDSGAGMPVCLLALPLMLLLSPLAEDIHYCLLIPALAGLCYVTVARRLWRLPATWTLWVALGIFSVPRMQELIYPSHLLALPGQADPAIGPLIVVVRSGTLLYLAMATLIAGASAIRATRGLAPRSPGPPARHG